MRMPIIRAVGLATLAAAIGVVPASAAPTDWPTTSKCQQADDDTAVKVYDGSNQTGTHKTECGDGWDQDNRDDDYADDDGWGTIRNFDNQTESMVLFNKTNTGACFIFAQGTHRSGKDKAYWVAKKPSGQPYYVREVDTLPSGMNNQVTSHLVVMNGDSGMTYSQCINDDW